MTDNTVLNTAVDSAAATEKLAQGDRATTLHPFTAVRAYEADETGGPRIIESGKGIRITDADGKTSIDGFAGTPGTAYLFTRS